MLPWYQIICIPKKTHKCKTFPTSSNLSHNLHSSFQRPFEFPLPIWKHIKGVEYMYMIGSFGVFLGMISFIIINREQIVQT